MPVVIPLAFSVFAFQGHVHEESLTTREAFLDFRQVNPPRLLAQCRNNRFRCIICLGAASRGILLGRSHTQAACNDKVLDPIRMMREDEDDDISTLVAQKGNVSQMIFQCSLQKKAKSHTRFIPSCYCLGSNKLH